MIIHGSAWSTLNQPSTAHLIFTSRSSSSSSRIGIVWYGPWPDSSCTVGLGHHRFLTTLFALFGDALSIPMVGTGWIDAAFFFDVLRPISSSSRSTGYSFVLIIANGRRARHRSHWHVSWGFGSTTRAHQCILQRSHGWALRSTRHSHGFGARHNGLCSCWTLRPTFPS